MKNYELKSATQDLSLGQKIIITGKRIAFLVPDVFRKLQSGFVKNFKKVQTSISNVAVDIANGFESAKENISNSFETKYNPTAAMMAAEEQVSQKYAEKDAETIAKIDAKIEKAEDSIVKLKASSAGKELDDENNKETSKERYYLNLAIIGYEHDIEKFQKQKIISNSPARRLLISTVFLGKLINNRLKYMKIVREKKMAERETRKAEMSVQKAAHDIAQLYLRRHQLVGEINNTDKQINKLVLDNGITEEMVRVAMKKLQDGLATEQNENTINENVR